MLPMEMTGNSRYSFILSIFNCHTWIEYENHSRVCIISLLVDTEELNNSQSILFINVIFM